MARSDELSGDLSFLTGGGETGALMLARDWSTSPLGPPQGWPQSLRSVVGLLLSSKFPMFVAWGEALGFLYNDAYAEILGAKHPQALGARFYDIWSEIWPDILPLIEAAMAGEAIYRENLPLVMNRKGYDEQTWFTFSYSPVRDESGRVAGMFCAVAETTGTVLAERWKDFRLGLEEKLRDAADAEAVMAAAAAALGRALDVARVGYGEIDADEAHVVVARDFTDGRIGSFAGRHLMAGFGPPIIAELKAGRVLAVDDVAADPRTGTHAAAFAAIGTRAVLAVPLVKAGRFIAVLFLHHPEPKRWTAYDVELASDVAERTWASVERARADAAPRARAARLRGVFDSEVTGLTIFDATSGETLAINDRFLGMTGHSRAEFESGRWDWRDFTVPEYLPLDDAAIADARTRGWWAPYEKEYLRRDGTRFPVRISSAPLPSEPGRVVVAVEDISDERAAKAALAASEALARARADELAAIYDAAPVGLCVLDRDLRYVRVNDRLAEINGLPAAEHIGRSVREVVPDLEAEVFETLRRVLDGEEVWNTEITGTTAAQPGVVRTWRENLLPLRNAAGEIVGITVSAEEITNAKAVEVALQESEARFRNMADHAPVMLWVTEPNGACTYLNRAWYAFTGQTPAEAEGLGWLEAVHPEDRGWSGETFLAANAAREAFRLEYRLKRHDGAYRWAIDAASPRFGPHGEFLGFIGSVVDIHERKAAEELLERRIADALAERKLFVDLIEGTDAFVQVLGPDFRFLALNRAAADELERNFGVRPRVGDDLLDLLADRPEHRRAVRAVWARALAGEAFTEIGAFGDPARDRRWYEMKYRPLMDPGGARIGAYQFVYDVTERIREQTRLAEAEAARREADALYRAYFENTPEALFVMGVQANGDFVVEQMNPAHEAGVGLKLADVRGKRLEDVLPRATAERIHERYRQVMETGEILQYRESYDLGGKSDFWDTSLVPMRDETGRIVRLIGSSRNVTRQVMAEEALRQSQKMESMGQLTGGVAHDFNNLLTPIVGALDLLQRRGVGGEREQRLIAGAAQSAERARTLVQRLLAFARRQPLQPIAVDVAKLVTGMADLIASTTGPQIKVVVDAARDLPPAKADPNQLEMAVLNLAVNARDAMPDGGTLRISVEAATIGRQHRSHLAPGRYLQLSVADTGVGMDEATLARAVEPFFSTKGVGKGTGLGLSMVHGLASQLGGAVTIRSTVGLGTNVELWLPQGERDALPVESDSAEAPLVARGTVLLVDDEDLVRLSTADMLIELGYNVVEAGSAEEALRLLNRGLAPDVVVTDHLMPGMSGTELARVLQTERPSIKVLVISGYAETAGIAPDLPRLTKPFRNAELAASLAALG